MDCAGRFASALLPSVAGTDVGDRPAPHVTSGPLWRYRMAVAATGGGAYGERWKRDQARPSCATTVRESIYDQYHPCPARWLSGCRAIPAACLPPGEHHGCRPGAGARGAPRPCRRCPRLAVAGHGAGRGSVPLGAPATADRGGLRGLHGGAPRHRAPRDHPRRAHEWCGDHRDEHARAHRPGPGAAGLGGRRGPAAYHPPRAPGARGGSTRRARARTVRPDPGTAGRHGLRRNGA